MRALRKRGIAVAPGKAGPDYIDPAFHAAASGTPCLNFDPWAMRPELISANAALHRVRRTHPRHRGDDGAFRRRGRWHRLAGRSRCDAGLSVVLVVDASRMSQSVAPLVSGFAGFRADVRIAGVILNKVGSDRHEAMLRQALDAIRMPVIAVIRSDKALALPERHLGPRAGRRTCGARGFHRACG